MLVSLCLHLLYCLSVSSRFVIMIDQMDEWIIFVLFTQLNLVYPPSYHNFVLIEFQLAEAAQELSQLSFVSASF